jgi:hypothetical protein
MAGVSDSCKRLCPALQCGQGFVPTYEFDTYSVSRGFGAVTGG